MRALRVGAGGELGRRLLGLLVLAIWLPLVLLGWISLREYESNLKLEATDRLAGRAKIAGLAIFERLQALRSDLVVAVSGLSPDDLLVDLLAPRPSWRDRFEGLFLTSGLDAPRSWQLPELGADSRARLREGLSTLVVE